MIENVFNGLLDEEEIEYNLVTDANCLYDGFLKSRDASKWKGSTQLFELNFLRRISRLQKRLINRTYEIAPGSTFILRERGKIRPIHAKTIDDRIVAHAFVDNVLMPIVRRYIIYDNCASIKGRGIEMQRRRLELHLHEYYRTYKTNKGWILLGDFTKFYDNIQHQKVYELFEKDIDDEYYLWLLRIFLNSFKIDVSYMSDEEYERCMDDIFDRLIYWTYSARVPLNGERYMSKSIDIGDQTSQAIGVYYPTKIDNYIKIVKGVRWYGRYMDDFYIINNSKEELKQILNEIIQIANEMGLFISIKKTYITRIDRKFKFLQLHYWLTHSGAVVRKINKVRVHVMRIKIRKLGLMVRTGRRESAYIVNMIRSWIGGYGRYMSKLQYWGLKKLIIDSFDEEIINEFNLSSTINE